MELDCGFLRPFVDRDSFLQKLLLIMLLVITIVVYSKTEVAKEYQFRPLRLVALASLVRNHLQLECIILIARLVSALAPASST